MHTWSLGVEEQFYLLYPLLLVYLLRRNRSRSRLGALLGAGAAVSLGLSYALTPHHSVLAFFTLPTRAWELLLGGVLSLLPRHGGTGGYLRETSGWLGLWLILLAVFEYNHSTPFPGTAALVPCLGTALAIWANSNGLTSSGKLLCLPWLVRLGLISYSVYLWHWPLFAFGLYLGLLGGVGARLAVVVASIALGYASWRWIETPARERRVLATRRSAARLFLAYASVAIALGAAGILSGGFSARFGHRAAVLAAGRHDRTFILQVNPLAQAQRYRVIGDRGAKKATFFLWEDSHAMSLAPLLDALAREHRLEGLQVTHSSAAPLLHWGYAKSTGWSNPSKTFRRKWAGLILALARRYRPKAIFLCARWSLYERPSFEKNLQQTVAAVRMGAHFVRIRRPSRRTCSRPWQPSGVAV